MIAFAEKEIGKCAHEIYFGDVSILTLKEISCECKKTANVIEEFGKLVSQISRTIFLTLVGATEQPQGVCSVDLSLAELSECALSNQRSFSRPFVSLEDDESYDFVSKKIKFD